MILACKFTLFTSNIQLIYRNLKFSRKVQSRLILDNKIICIFIRSIRDIIKNVKLKFYGIPK